MPRFSVSPGQQFTTPEANALLRMQREWQSSKRRGVGDKILHQEDSQTIAWCYNATGSNLLHGQIVGIDFDTNPIDPAYDGWHEVMLVRGETPAIATHHSGAFGVTLEAIPNQAIGKVCVAGACRVRLSITNAADKFAELTEGIVSYLTTGGGGPARVLYKPTGTGLQWGSVRLGNAYPIVLGKADSAIANAASGPVRVYAGTPGSEADTSQTIASCFNKGPAIADEAWVTVGWMHGKPYVALLNCP